MDNVPQDAVAQYIAKRDKMWKETNRCPTCKHGTKCVARTLSDRCTCGGHAMGTACQECRYGYTGSTFLC